MLPERHQVSSRIIPESLVDEEVLDFFKLPVQHTRTPVIQMLVTKGLEAPASGPTVHTEAA